MRNSLLILVLGLIFVFIAGIMPATACVATYDYGDAPDSYSTRFLNGGAYHGTWSGLYLGSGVNDEFDGQPGFFADADYFDDGVDFTTALIPGSTANVDVTASIAGILNAWIDFNGNGYWGDAGEQIFENTALAAGTNPLSFYIPDTASLGYTYARFRLNSAGGLNYFGSALDGEVEDYRVEINSVPLPASMVLLGIGLIGFAGISRKKVTN